MNEEISKFTNHQIDIQRKNLIQISRLTVKTLLDKASITDIDDDSEELINFCAAIEQILTYRQKAQRTWYGIEEVQPFWSFIQTACQYLPNNCIHSIATLENVKSATGKGRAWIRCVLMEKRLSEYLRHAVQQTKIVKRFYLEGSVIMSDEFHMLCDVLLGLNSIDFSFCLKGQNNELKCPLFIDFTPYLMFQQSEESVSMDKEELAELNQNPTENPKHDMGTNQWETKYRELEKTHKHIKEQKGYLEELVRQRDHQLQELQRKHQNLMKVFKKFDEESKLDRLQMENVVIELQQQLTSVTSKFETINNKYENLVGKLNTGYIDLDDVIPQSSSPWKQGEGNVQTEQHSLTSDGSVRLMVPPSSSSKDQVDRKQESVSMLAMAGSFSSQKSIDATDSNIPQSDVDSVVCDAEEAIVINFPTNDNQSVSSATTSLADDSNDVKELPGSSAEMFKTTSVMDKEPDDDNKHSKNSLNSENQSNTTIPTSEPSKEDNSSEQSGDNSTSSPEILQPSEEEVMTGSDSSVNEEQYDLVTDDVSKFNEKTEGQEEDNQESTG